MVWMDCVVYPFVHPSLDPWVVSTFGCFERCCFGHGYTNTFLKPAFHSSGDIPRGGCWVRQQVYVQFFEDTHPCPFFHGGHTTLHLHTKHARLPVSTSSPTLSSSKFDGSYPNGSILLFFSSRCPFALFHLVGSFPGAVMMVEIMILEPNGSDPNTRPDTHQLRDCGLLSQERREGLRRTSKGQTGGHGSSLYCQHDLGWAACLGRTVMRRTAHMRDPAAGKLWRGPHPGHPPLRTAPLGAQGRVAAASEAPPFPAVRRASSAMS